MVVRIPPIVLAGAGVALAVHVIAAGSPAQPDPLGTFSASARAELRRGAPAFEVPREHGRDISIMGAVRTTADPDRLVAWSREIVELQRGKYVPLIGRFSSPPRPEDLASLVLDDEDLEDLRDCRPGHCHVKLSAAEMRQLNAALSGAGRGWRSIALDTFRTIVLARAHAFQRDGFRGVPPYVDDEEPVDAAAEFRLVRERFSADALFTPRVAQYLQSYPRSTGDQESFLYWSKDLLGDAKPIISITHLAILHGTSDEPTIVAATQVFATHYLNASLTLTAITTAPGEEGRYLFYVRRSRADVFSGAFGGLIRRIVSRRVRAEGPPLLDGFRRNLERGSPGRRGTAGVRLP